MVELMNPIGRIALEMITNSNGLPQPSFKGEVVAREGEDVSHIEEITVDIVKDGSLVYYDTGAHRHFHAPSEDFAEVSE